MAEDGQIVAAKNPIRALFEDPAVQARFQNILGKKAPGFIVSVINAVTNDTTLIKADKQSILFAAATAATLDLPINPNLGFAYIVPYKGKAQFQMGYKGFIQLAHRTGQFRHISQAIIYEGQLVAENPLTGFEFDFTKKISDKIQGYAAYFELLNGFSHTLYMSIEEVRKHGKKYSQSWKSGYGQWEDNFDAMALKTVIKLLLSKHAPLSIEMQKAVMVDQGVINNWEGTEINYEDNDSTPPTVEDVSNEKEEKPHKAMD
jgi:recombination protein RecT